MARRHGVSDKRGPAMKRFIATRWSRIVLVSLTALGLVFSIAPIEAASAYTPYTGTDIVQVAQMSIGDGACSSNPAGNVGFASSCTGNGGQPEYWCADFARWVWAAMGVPYASELNAAAASFYTYGVRHGTLTSMPAVGDAVVFDYSDANGVPYADHVAIVSQVNPNGTIESISGDWGGTGSTEAAFSSTSSVVLNAPPYPSAVGSTSNVMGMTISGFIAPVGVAPASGPQEPDGTVIAAVNGAAKGLEAVASGNRAFAFSSGAELAALGYGSKTPLGVTSNYIIEMTAATNGHLVRNPSTGVIEVSAGGAYGVFYTLQDLWTQYPNPKVLTVDPQAFPPANTTPYDGTLMRNAAGTEAVVVGGRLIVFGSGQQLAAAGQSGNVPVNVPSGYLNSSVFSPSFASGHLMVDAQTGCVAVTVGGVIAGFASSSDLRAQYPYSVPVGVSDQQFAAFTGTPADGTLMQNTAGTVAVAAGGGVFGFPTGSDLASAGYGGTAPVRVPGGYFNTSAFSPAPRNGTLLRTPEGTIVVVVGGARIGFSSGQELSATGYQASRAIELSDSMLSSMPTVPANGTVVAAPGSSQQWVIENGTKKQATTPISSPVMVPSSYLNSLQTS